MCQNISLGSEVKFISFALFGKIFLLLDFFYNLSRRTMAINLYPQQCYVLGFSAMYLVGAVPSRAGCKLLLRAFSYFNTSNYRA